MHDHSNHSPKGDTMKLLLNVCIALVVLAALPAGLQAQYILDTNLTVVAQIHPSDYPSWPNNIGAEKILSGFDINGNGKKEFIVMANPTDNNTADASDTTRPYLFWFEANGDNTYSLLWSAHVPGTNTAGYSYGDFTVADIDKDGKMEIVVVIPRAQTDREDAVLYVYEYDNGAFPADPTFNSNLGLRPGMAYRSSRVEVADVDGDGDNEVVVTSRNDDYGGTGSGRTLLVEHFFGGDINPESFGFFEREFIDSSSVLKGGAVYDMGITDFDGDGKKEIWVATWDLLSLAIYETTGKDAYALQADINQARPSNDVGVRRSMRWYDADKNGHLEYYFAGITDASNPGDLYTIPSTSDVSTLTTASVLNLTPDLAPEAEWSYEGADIGDVNGDGLMDYIVTGPGPRREIFWLHYKGGDPADSANFRLGTAFKDTLAADSLYSFNTVDIGNDLDNDGKREILIPNRYVRDGVATDASVIILESNSLSTGVNQAGDVVPSGYALSQNYPNPFNPQTEITFQTPQQGFVSLKVYDMLGREIATLVNRELPVGNHRATFDARGVSSGTYFYTLKAGSFLETRKMLVVK
jgi:hypothetical protein